MKKYRLYESANKTGRPKKISEEPLEEGIFHNELGVLSWELKNGNVLVCRSYHEYTTITPKGKEDKGNDKSIL